MNDDLENELDNPAEPEELVFLGRVLGTFKNWDGDINEVFFYDFIPGPDTNLVAGSLSIDINKGKWSIDDDEGRQLEGGDVVELLSKLPRK